MFVAMKVSTGGAFATTDQDDDYDAFACGGRGFQWVTCLRCAAYCHIRNRYLREYRSGCVHGRPGGCGEAQACNQYVPGKAQRRKSQDRTRHVARGTRALHADGGLSLRQQGRRRLGKESQRLATGRRPDRLRGGSIWLGFTRERTLCRQRHRQSLHQDRWAQCQHVSDHQGIC